MAEIAVPKARSSGVFAFAVSLLLHAVAVVALIISIRSTFDLFAELALAGLAGSSLAILGALVLSPMFWRYRVVLATAILVGVAVGTVAMMEGDVFENPWPNHLPLGLDWGESARSKYDARTFFGYASVFILGSAMALVGGLLAGKSAHRFLRKRMKTRTIILLGAALLLLLVSQYQTFVMNGGLFFQSTAARTFLTGCGALVFVLVPTMILFWSRSSLWAGLGPILVMLIGSVTVGITSSWLPSGASRPPVVHLIVLSAGMAAFAAFLILVGWPLRFLGIRPDRKSKRPGGVSFCLAMAPAIAMVISGWQFMSNWDPGAVVCGDGWKIASAIATGRKSGVCLNYTTSYPTVFVAESAEPDSVGELFRKFSDEYPGTFGRIAFRGLRPGIDLSYLEGLPPIFGGACPVFHLERCLLDEQQLASLSQPGNTVVIMDAIQIEFGLHDVIINGTFDLRCDNDVLIEFLKHVNLEGSSFGINFDFECIYDDDLAELISILELLSRSRCVNDCRFRVTVPESGDSRLKALARAEIDWRKIQLNVYGGELPLEVVQEILGATYPGFRMPIPFNNGNPDETKKRLRLMLAYPDLYYYQMNSYAENVLTQIDGLKSVEGIREAGYVFGDGDGSGRFGMIALRRKWLDVLSDEQIQSTECLVVGGTPLGSVQSWTVEEYAGLSPVLAKFTQLRELHGDQSCFHDFGFLQNMTELRSLRLVADKDSGLANAIRDYPFAMAKLERLVLIGQPSPEILAAIKTLPSLRSLTILSRVVEVEPEVSQKIQEMFPDLDAKVIPVNRFLEFEPETLQLHRQRLRDQFKRETEGK